MTTNSSCLFVVIVTFFLSVQHYVYPLAIDERALRNGRSIAVDFIDAGRAKSTLYEEQMRSKDIYEEALTHCREKFNCSQEELAVVSPRYSSCAWLQVSHMDHSGLGHTFATWVFYMQKAWENGLTFHSPFYTAAHDTSSYLNSSAYLLGLHSVYYWGRIPSENALKIKIGTFRGDCSPEALSEAVRKYKSSRGFDCSKGDVVFVCYNEHVDLQQRILRRTVDVINPLRAAFTAGYHHNRDRYTKKLDQLSYKPKANRESDSIAVVVHMRRGDILQSKRVDRDHRLVSAEVYMNVLKYVIKRFNKKNSKTKINIYILCEGAIDENHVVEFDEINPRDLFDLNISASMYKYCNPNTNCSLKVMGSKFNILESFTAMCESDVFVSSPSGFSWITALLCDPELTIAFPLGGSFDGLSHEVIFPRPADKEHYLWESNINLIGLN